MYNFGNGRGISVREVIHTAEEVVGRLIPAMSKKRRPGYPALLVASTDKAGTWAGNPDMVI